MTDTTNETQVEVTQDRASEIACEIMGEMLGIPASEVSADCTGAKLIRRGIYRFEDCHRIQAEKRTANRDVVEALTEAEHELRASAPFMDESAQGDILRAAAGCASVLGRIQAEKRNNALADELRALDALFQDQIELNPSNYDHDDACRLNTEAVEICTNWRAVYPRILAALEGDE